MNSPPVGASPGPACFSDVKEQMELSFRESFLKLTEEQIQRSHGALQQLFNEPGSLDRRGTFEYCALGHAMQRTASNSGLHQ
eukprot:Skav234647  [mRNA]  locus=scaffold1609:394090:398321:+ [translate_table: standard]